MQEFLKLELYQIDSLPTEDGRLVRASVRRWVRRRIFPGNEGWCWDCRFPTELVPEMADLGPLGAPYAEHDLNRGPGLRVARTRGSLGAG
jgi:alkylation response protein AidB-like acyl-CoA dehydrogenase